MPCFYDKFFCDMLARAEEERSIGETTSTDAIGICSGAKPYHFHWLFVCMCASVGGIVEGGRHAHEQIIQLQQLQEV